MSSSTGTELGRGTPSCSSDRAIQQASVVHDSDTRSPLSSSRAFPPLPVGPESDSRSPYLSFFSQRPRMATACTFRSPAPGKGSTSKYRVSGYARILRYGFLVVFLFFAPGKTVKGLPVRRLRYLKYQPTGSMPHPLPRPTCHTRRRVALTAPWPTDDGRLKGELSPPRRSVARGGGSYPVCNPPHPLLRQL